MVPGAFGELSDNVMTNEKGGRICLLLYWRHLLNLTQRARLAAAEVYWLKIGSL